MHRIRAGMTGLGLVFLITLIGSVAVRSPEAAPGRSPGEPLGALGIAPSPGGDPATDQAGQADRLQGEQPVADHLPPRTTNQVHI
ncbi:hypothetical protein [Thermaurantiacus sp.]